MVSKITGVAPTISDEMHTAYARETDQKIQHLFKVDGKTNHVKIFVFFFSISGTRLVMKDTIGAGVGCGRLRCDL